MPKLTLSNHQLRIYDDFLPHDLLGALLEHANGDEYEMVHQEVWRKVWRLGDGLPLQGTMTYHRKDPALYEPNEKTRYPTNGPLDPFLDAVSDTAEGTEELLGKRGSDWTSIAVSPWVYPAGSGLSLHRDHYNATGSFTYFVHRQWNFHWGGQLLVLDPQTGRNADPDDSPFSPAFLSDDDENEIISDPGLATCILPKPNRMVIITGTAYHLITRVNANAGDRARVAFAGFFMRPKSESSAA